MSSRLLSIVFFFIVLITTIAAKAADELQFAYPSAAPTTNGTAAPTISAAPSISHTPSANGTAAPTAAVTVSHSPTISQQPSQNPTNSSSTPNPTNSQTSKPTKIYTAAPTLHPDEPKPTPSKIHSVFKFLLWSVVIFASLLGFGKCMSHRAQIYQFLRRFFYKLKIILEIGLGGISDGCGRVGHTIGRLELGRRLGELVGGFRAWIDRVRGRGRRGGVMDDDGSTMMQGLLLRENL